MATATSISAFLNAKGVEYSVLEHPLAYTAQQEAAAAHVSGREWAKTVVYFADDEPIMAVLPAHLVVDARRLKELAGASTLRLATERDLARLYPDCEVGAEPPLGPLYHQRVFVDRALAEDECVVFDAGTHRDAIKMRYSDYARLTKPIVGAFGAGAPAQ